MKSLTGDSPQPANFWEWINWFSESLKRFENAPECEPISPYDDPEISEWKCEEYWKQQVASLEMLKKVIYQGRLLLMNLGPKSVPPLPTLTKNFDDDRVALMDHCQELMEFAIGEIRLEDSKGSTTATTANDERDKWLYEQCCKLVKYETIISRLSKKTKWEPIDTPQGIKDAANRYADRHNLPSIPFRQPGRKCKHK